MAKRKNDDDDRDDEKGEEQKKPDKDDKPEKPEKAGVVRARAARACVVNGCYIKPGEELSFPAGRVNPHFEVIGE